MATLAEIRSKYPDYKDLNDKQLADALYTAHYSDMPRDQFDKSVGLKSARAPSFMETAANTAGDVAHAGMVGLAKGASSILGIPGDIQHAANRGIRAVVDWAGGDTGAIDRAAKMQLAPQGSDFASVINRADGGNFTPQTTPGKYAQTIASFVPGGSALGIGRALIPGALSEFAGQKTAGTAAEPYARTIGALVGGAVPSIAGAGIRTANKAVAAVTGGNGFLDPTVEASRRLAGAFSSDGGLPAATSKADSFASSGASSPSVLDIGGGNVRRLIRAAAGGGDTAQTVAQNYGDRVRANLQDNVIERAGQLTPDARSPAQASTQVRQAQVTQANRDYAGPGNQPVSLEPEAARALRGNTGTAAIDRAMKDAEINQDYQTIDDLNAINLHDLDKPTVVSGRAVEAIRQAYGRMSEEAAAKPGGGYAQSGLLGRQGALDSTLDQAPGFSEARQNFRTNQSAIDAVPLGGRVLTAPSNQYAAEIGQLAGVGGPPDLRGLQVGARQAITDAVEAPAAGATGVLNKIGTSNRATANLAATYGERAAGSFQEAVRNEVSRLRNANAISPESGSQTQLRLADEGLMGGIPTSVHSFVSKIADKIFRGTQLTPAEREQIVRLGTSEADIRRFAQSAPQGGISRAVPTVNNLNASRTEGQN